MKRAILFYLLYTSTTIFLFFFRSSIEELFANYTFFLIFPLIPIIVSQIIGYLIFHFKENHKSKILNYTYSTIFTILFLSTSVKLLLSWNYQRNNENIDANTKFTNESLQTKFEFSAFHTLNKLIKDENSFKLNAFFIENYDTIISGKSKNYEFIKFHYYNEKTQNEYTTKFVNLNDKAFVVYFNKNLNSKEKYTNDSIVSDAKNTFKEVAKTQPDSQKKKLQD